MRKYFEFVHIEFQQEWHHRGAALSRVAFYGVILFIFSQLWKAVSVQTNFGLTSIEMLWYLAMTELIVLSFPLVHLDIEEDVRSGNISYFLVRPFSYVGSRYARAMGSMLCKYLILAGAGWGFAWLFSGGLLPNLSGLMVFVPLSLLSVSVSLIYIVIIGVTSLWIQDCSPIYWVWQKLGFVLGGMILPLDIYPLWLKELAAWTPFTAFLYDPVMASIRADYDMAFLALLKLLFWGVVGVLLLKWTFLKAEQGLTINGGS